MQFYILITLIYLIFFVYIIYGFNKTKKLRLLKKGTLNENPPTLLGNEKLAFLKTRIASNDHYLKLSFWATFISGIISLGFALAILLKFSFIEDSNISELIKLVTCLTNFSFAGIFVFLIKEFNKMGIELTRELNKIEI